MTRKANPKVDEMTSKPNEIQQLMDVLSQLIAPEALASWLRTPNASFDGLTPIELIEQGDIDQLWNMVFELQTGMPG